MNWDAFGALAEGLGALVIIVSILYLSRQIRESTRYASAEAERHIQESFIAIHDSLSSDREAFLAFRKALAGFDDLSDAEKAHAHIRFNIFINHLEMVLRMKDKSLVDAEIADTYGNVVVGVMSTPGGQEYWNRSGHTYQKNSRLHINERLADGSEFGDSREVFPYMFSDEA